ncbi:MAG: hypothetical protein FJY88_07625 [Candidatus Eisenbacteria bacterium]|nr:hypothetical protein [Candidatus Eisenbacteria bacterium]
MEAGGPAGPGMGEPMSGSPGHEFLAAVHGVRKRVRIGADGEEHRIEIDGHEHRVAFIETGPGDGCLLVDGRPHCVGIQSDGKGLYKISVGGREIPVEVAHALAGRVARTAQGDNRTGPIEVRSPMPGLVVHVHVAIGDLVAAESPLVVLEAMKMQNALTAPKSCVVRKIAVEPGQTVEGDALLVVLEPTGASA